MPAGGLKQTMFRPYVTLTEDDVLLAEGLKDDKTLHDLQRYWIFEAIRYCHRDAVDFLFAENPSCRPTFPTIERLEPQTTTHRSLGPILENEGTLDGTLAVLNEVLFKHLNLKEGSDFNDLLYLIYGDQKTVSLVLGIKHERREAGEPHAQYSSVIPIPGLFHWRMNFIDMVHDLYSGEECPSNGSTLQHNKHTLNYKMGNKSPFHFKEEVALRAFEARVVGIFYSMLPGHVSPVERADIDTYIKQIHVTGILHKVDQIRQDIFSLDCQSPPSGSNHPVDYELSAHAKFLQQMEVYKTLKLAIKRGDIGLIRRVFPQCSILFQGSSKKKYAELALYMAWLTQSRATDPELQKAILSNSLVNLNGKPDGFFETDRLNEFFNLQMKTIMATRRTSTMDVANLFQRTALSASYCTDLRGAIEAAFGEYSNIHHTDKDASRDVYELAQALHRQRSTRLFSNGRESCLPGWPIDIYTKGSHMIPGAIQRFNTREIYGKPDPGDMDDDQDDMSGPTTTPITSLDQYVDDVALTMRISWHVEYNNITTVPGSQYPCYHQPLYHRSFVLSLSLHSRILRPTVCAFCLL